MSSAAAVAAHGAHAEPHALGFWRTYIFSEDHKMIGKQFLFMALFMMSIGGLMAMLMTGAKLAGGVGDFGPRVVRPDFVALVLQECARAVLLCLRLEDLGKGRHAIRHKK